jgi:hypothetical protein
VILAPHHIFGPAREGHITCLACHHTYTVETAWQALVDPCIDGVPTGITEIEALERYRAALNDTQGSVVSKDELREQMAMLVAGRMALHWPLQCPMCPDRSAMAIDIVDSLLASRDLIITGIESPHD